jgi:protein TilB
MRHKDEKKFEKKKPDTPKLNFGLDGRILQRNEGKWEYKWIDKPKTIQLTVEISKFLDTSHIDVDCQPNHTKVIIKGKELILCFNEAVRPDTLHCERSRLTGQLLLTVQKAVIKESIMDMEKELGKLAVDAKLTLPNETVKKPQKLEFDPTKSSVLDYRSIVANQKLKDKKMKGPLQFKNTSVVGKIREQPHLNSVLMPDDFEDDPDVPPLC